jgi:hypothetical protein
MIYINNIPSLRDSDNGDGLLIDDRKTETKLINGTTYQNGGAFLNGIQLSCVFHKINFNQILHLWLGNATVSYTDKNGKTFTGFTIKIDKITPVDFFKQYYQIDFTLLKEQRTPLNVNDFLIT